MYTSKFIIRSLSTNIVLNKKVATNNITSKSLKSSSKQWLSRQLSDPYVEKAKIMNLRCRSAFKLIEIDDRFKILTEGQTVIDCGAAPGSWSQVAAKRINSDGHDATKSQGKLLAIDKQQMYPIDGAITLGNMDFTQTSTQECLREKLGDSKPNVVLSDMAPSATGISDLDNENIINLCYSVLRFALQVSDIDGTILVKLWQCGQTKQLQTDMEKFYKIVKIVKPNSSRSDSAEIFMLGKNFKGLKPKS